MRLVFLQVQIKILLLSLDWNIGNVAERIANRISVFDSALEYLYRFAEYTVS